jgi:hypothetical protein
MTDSPWKESELSKSDLIIMAVLAIFVIWAIMELVVALIGKV